jgi:glucose 1-dehydrogenase
MSDARPERLAGKVALVTGSGQGICQAIAIRLAEEGADVVVDDRVIGESAEQTVEAIQKLGRRVATVQGDLSNTTDDRRIIAEGVAKLGKIDILVNNAGVERRADFWDVTEQDFDFVVNNQSARDVLHHTGFCESPARDETTGTDHQHQLGS